MEIYLISDNAETPQYPEELHLEFIERFTFEEFRQIEGFMLNADFFKDFRLTNSSVKIAYNKLIQSQLYQNSNNKIASINKLKNIFQSAICQDLGFLGFSD